MRNLNKFEFIAIFLTLNVADIFITVMALKNPAIAELNAIPFMVLFPLKIVMPFFMGAYLYSEAIHTLRAEHYRDITVWFIIMMYVAILINNTYWMLS
jgi:hypothetical protein